MESAEGSVLVARKPCKLLPIQLQPAFLSVSTVTAFESAVSSELALLKHDAKLAGLDVDGGPRPPGARTTRTGSAIRRPAHSSPSRAAVNEAGAAGNAGSTTGANAGTKLGRRRGARPPREPARARPSAVILGHGARSEHAHSLRFEPHGTRARRGSGLPAAPPRCQIASLSIAMSSPAVRSCQRGAARGLAGG